jgi:EAL domain-containing protein (putative c-di-GMP-specific phosphodiesterase class I)
MDSRNILSKKIIPYFQPIIAIDTGDIYSYEVLGRYVDDGGSVKSLGAFFSDKNVSGDETLEVDRIVRKQALEQFAKEGKDKYLFINIRLEWIAKYADELEKLPTLLWMQELGIDPTKLVIEITEEEFNTDDKTLHKLVDYYKKSGCRIAIDDYGKQASNIDRLAALSPDIIKICMEYVQKSEESDHYREYMRAISSFAERVGIEVLYEGVETQEQLDICIETKGRFFQGFLLAKPQPSISNASMNHEIFSSSTHYSIEQLHHKSSCVNKLRQFWDLRIERYFAKREFNFAKDDINDYFSKLLIKFSGLAKRIYLCNNYGEQLSYNIEIEGGKIKLVDYKQRNWAWRKYFQEATLMFKAGMKSYLTTSYKDAITKQKIYTYIYFINKDLYLLIDTL